MRNKKTAVVVNSGLNNNFNDQKNYTKSDEKTQPNLNFGKPPKIINCFSCHHEKEFDGYLFKLVEVCRHCRTESEVLITRKRFERRRASK